MSQRSIGRPDPSEYADYARVYVDRVDGSDIEGALTRQIVSTTAMLSDVDDTRARTFAYAPGKWTINDIVAHLIDSERIFSCRALCVARGEQQPLPGFEQADYAQLALANDRTLVDLLDEFSIVRKSTIALFGSFPDDVWLRRGTAAGYGVTVRGLAFCLTGHELHHVSILRERYGVR
jgi:hypothetical protein